MCYLYYEAINYLTCFCVILQNSSRICTNVIPPEFLSGAACVLSVTDNSCVSPSLPVLSVAHKMPVSCLDTPTMWEQFWILKEFNWRSRGRKRTASVVQPSQCWMWWNFTSDTAKPFIFLVSKKCIMVKTLEQTSNVPWFGIYCFKQKNFRLHTLYLLTTTKNKTQTIELLLKTRSVSCVYSHILLIWFLCLKKPTNCASNSKTLNIQTYKNIRNNSRKKLLK